MKNKNTNLLYAILGCFLLISLQSGLVKSTLGLSNFIGIPYFWNILSTIINVISFFAAILFIFLSIKLILNNIKSQD